MEKVLKIALTLLLGLISFVLCWHFITYLLTLVNPNYIIEDGQRYYVMNTGNMVLSFIITSFLLLIIGLLYKRKK